MTNKISVAEYRRDFKLVGSKQKYRNQKIIHEGKKFDSIAENIRYYELLIRQRSGQIRDLSQQRRFEVIPKTKDERSACYVADFVYFDVALKSWVIEDKKSPMTRKLGVYVLKRKLTKIKYPDYIFIES